MTWAVITATCVIVLAHYAIARDVYNELLRICVIMGASILVVGFSPAAASCFVTPGWPTRDQAGAFAWWLFGLCAVTNGFVSLFYRLADRPAWLTSHPVSNAWAYGALILVLVGFFGARLHEGGMPRWQSRTIFSLSVLAIITAVYLTVAHPNLRPVSEWIEVVFLGPSEPQ